jgi:hypothetical protein
MEATMQIGGDVEQAGEPGEQFAAATTDRTQFLKVEINKVRIIHCISSRG